jgi:exopolysaccharide biosynthesis WecB/TagA/CpsF family protein
VHEVDNFDLNTFARVAASFGCERFGYVVTPNIDHLSRYQESATFRAHSCSADYVLNDSRLAAVLWRVLKGVRLPVCPGSDLTAALLAGVIRPNDRVVLIGGRPEQAAMLAAAYGLTNLRHHDPPMGFIQDPAALESCLQFIEAASPFRFCFLAVGSPQQEELAYRLKARGTVRGLALCIGASINYLTGVEKRAPRWVRALALEWLYRLLHDPRRLARRYLWRGPRSLAHVLRTHIVVRGA